MKCRFCETPLNHSLVDLGMSPVANANIAPEQAEAMEPFFPLHARVCHQCWLVQIPEVEKPQDIFKEDYAYLSSYSDSWLAHCREYVNYATDRFALNPKSFIVEIASNDGYLLQYFVQKGFTVLGIDPAANAARLAKEKGVETRVSFFGEKTAAQLAAEGKQADLIVGNNVLAHVPDINDFVRGLKILLSPKGIITLEFPHLLQLIKYNQFDTIYHEHYSYLSLLSVNKIFEHFGLAVCDVQELPTHGGSLRVHACHSNNLGQYDRKRVIALLQTEKDEGLDHLERYTHFAEQVKSTKRTLLDLMVRIKSEGKSIVGYGAPAKGNTLLNYCGIRQDFIDYTVDRNPQKQGKLLPGSHIPIYLPDKILETKPDYIVILPWNLKEEIMQQLKYVRDWGCKFIIPIPSAVVA